MSNLMLQCNLLSLKEIPENLTLVPGTQLELRSPNGVDDRGLIPASTAIASWGL